MKTEGCKSKSYNSRINAILGTKRRTKTNKANRTMQKTRQKKGPHHQKMIEVRLDAFVWEEVPVSYWTLMLLMVKSSISLVDDRGKKKKLFLK